MVACPCGSGRTYEECCGPCHRGARKPETAEALMRSRYSAYAKSRLEYLRESLHPRKRRDYDAEHTRQWAQRSQWLGLRIVATEAGGPEDTSGTVEFIAHYRPEGPSSGGQEVEHHEIGHFAKEGDTWYYVDGKVLGSPPVRREAPRVGRNDPCPCGSGKKYKKCCGR